MRLDNSDYGKALVELAMSDGGITSEEAEAMSLLGAGPGDTTPMPSYRTKPFHALSRTEAQLVFEELAFVVACDGDVAVSEERTLRSLGRELSLHPGWIGMALKATHDLADAIRIGGISSAPTTVSPADESVTPKPPPIGEPTQAQVSPVAALARWTTEVVGEYGDKVLVRGAAAAGGAAAGAAASSFAYAGLGGALLKGAVFFSLAPTPAVVVAAPILGAAAAAVAAHRLARFWRVGPG